jgi:multiple sugar transport system ATP-binding protein
MNFMPATLENGTAHLPMVDVQLPQEILARLGSRRGSGDVIAGIRPEDFEDATKVDGSVRGRGITFPARFDLVEAMGAEYYAHFGINAKEIVASEELQELRSDAGGVESTDSGDTVLVARLSAQSSARAGEQSDLWLDSTKLHFFDSASGEALTYKG